MFIETIQIGRQKCSQTEDSQQTEKQGNIENEKGKIMKEGNLEIKSNT